MYLPNDNSHLFCLEAVSDVENERDSAVFPFLEHLALRYGITNVYKSCDSIEGFEESLNILLYEDRNFKDYEILYFVFEGSRNNIEIDRYNYSLEEIAELFEGKLTDKIIHFANTKTLDIDTETAQYFLSVTGAKALSGYTKKAPISSAVLDSRFFGLYQDIDDLSELVEFLFDENYNLCTSLGFELHY
ncbi:DUF6642 family protein [Flavobacterium sp. NKUCC04_CG]|uniref:DUF6642 family protein n=1 Tax=Flavobacterium sp. NKUCC04_CG TaxID=2842121 RepID=UPI001C5BE363|nr:DUF6642 family protein [Flavobacterium sp. NKUCC04_CG]MBW3519662.1 hypothetical protein [Flavobacterium sp. NKUCC04_CG]